MSRPAGASAYALAYEVAPIALVGGLAGGVPGGVMSVLSLLNSAELGGLDGDGTLDSVDQAFANFMPIPGATLIEAQYGTYPFANLRVAANARVAQPLTVSMLMRVPVREAGGYAAKQAIMTALQNTLDQHSQMGGYFSVATPSFFYNNALLLKLHDVSGGESLQTQTTYQWDFFCPLLTVQQAQATQNAAMQLLSSGGQTDGSLSGTGLTLGKPQSTAGVAVSPAVSGAANAQIPSSPTLPYFASGLS